MWLFKKKKSTPKQEKQRDIYHYCFVASDVVNDNCFDNVDKFVDNFPDFLNVSLHNNEVINVLLDLMNIRVEPIETPKSDYCLKYWDLSNIRLPEFTEEELDLFYEKWLIRSGRNNNMDEYGQLIFLCGDSKEMNRMNYKFLVQETLK